MLDILGKGLVLAMLIALMGSCDQNTTARLDDGGNTGESVIDPFDSINTQIKANPNDATLYFERAKVHYGLRDLSSSLSDVGRALRLDSTNHEFYILLSDLKLLNKESRESRDALLKAHKIAPRNTDILVKLGELYMVVGDADASFKYLNLALKEDVYLAAAYRLKGFNYKYLGDTINAVSSFQTAVEQDPNDYDAYMQLGLLHAEGGKELALDYFNNAIRISPASAEALYAKGLYLQTTDRPREAIKTYEDILSQYEEYFDAWYNIGYIHLEMLEKYDSAAYCFNQAIVYGPKNYYPAVYNRGLSKERSGKLREAEADYREALKMNPQYDLAALGLSRVLGE